MLDSTEQKEVQIGSNYVGAGAWMGIRMGALA